MERLAQSRLDGSDGEEAATHREHADHHAAIAASVLRAQEGRNRRRGREEGRLRRESRIVSETTFSPA